MKNVLITGGNGGLGQALQPRLRAQGFNVAVTSRRPAPAGKDADLGWFEVDFESGAGMAEAVQGQDIIIHAASSAFGKTQAVDVDGTGRLLAAAEAAGVGHFFYISIVGVDKIPFAYYQGKYAAEQLIAQSSLSWSILRATQFHSLLDMFLGGLDRLPLFMAPLDFRFQTIAAAEVADHIVAGLAAGKRGRWEDIGGPAVMTLAEMLPAWQAARGRQRRAFRLPLPGGVARSFRAGLNTTPANAVGKTTWAEWLAAQYDSAVVETRPILEG